MRIERVYILNRDDVNEHLHYRLIVESMGGSMWQTSKVQRAYEEQFTKQERRDIKCNIHRKAYVWYLKTGIPDEVQLPESEYKLWKRLVKFCVDNCTMYGRRRNNG